MEFVGKVLDASLNLASGKYQITFEVEDKESLISGFDSIKDESELTVKAVKLRHRRSLDSNAYAWTLIHKIAAKLGANAEEVYRHYVKSFGVCEIVPIKEEAIERWETVWRGKGYGWIVEDMGECRNFKGYHNIKCFYGSSSYNTQEMSVLIDAIVQDCKELEIDTATPAEIERMKSLWENQ